MRSGARDLASRILVTDVRTPGLRGCCWSWRGAHDDAHRARIKLGGKSRQVRRVVLEASGEPLASDDHVVALCRNPSCVNRFHLARGTAQECRALGRHGRIGLGELWLAKTLVANREATCEALSLCFSVSPRFLAEAVERIA
jgi:hypothetical protein